LTRRFFLTKETPFLLPGELFTASKVRCSHERKKKMKKLIRSGVSVLTCLAVLMTTLFFASPLKSSAAGTGTVTITVEGAQNTIYSDTVSFSDGDFLYPILEQALASKSIHITASDTQYGKYISEIGGETAASNYSTWWSLYVNGAASSVGASSLKLTSGQNIVLALVGNNTVYPQIKTVPQSPVAGQSFKVNVSADKVTYDANWNPTTTHIDLPGVSVVYNGASYTTDLNGDAVVANSGSVGANTLSVSENRTGSYPLIVRTKATVNVAAAPTQPTGGDFDEANCSVTFILSDNASSTKDAVLTEGFKSTSRDRFGRATVFTLPKGTVITGPQSWDGSFKVPTNTPVSSLNVPNGSARMAVNCGLSGSGLTFSDFAVIVMPGQSGKLAGYFDESGSFHSIPKLASNAAPSSGDDGYYDDTANDTLVVYTKHMSSFVAYSPSVSVTDTAVSDAVSGAASYLSSDTSDWTAFARVRAGFSLPSGYLASVASELKENGGDLGSPAALAKTILALRAAGVDPTNFDGYNLVEKLANYDGLDSRYTVNFPIFALIALSSADYQRPSTDKWNADNLIALICSKQGADGGFALADSFSEDCDITSMALAALAPHVKTNAAAAQAAAKALSYLSSIQRQNGGFVSAGSDSESSESDSQVVIALSAAGVDPLTDSRFLKNGKSPLDALMAFRNSDGGFSHVSGSKSDLIATQQALMALNAYQRFVSQTSRLYDLSDVAVNLAYKSAVANPKTDDASLVFTVLPCALAALALSRPRRRNNR
jgi:hypothetical protein